MELGSQFLVRGGPRRARPARRASLAARAGLASRRASLAAHGPAGCDPQVLQLAVGSGRCGEGGGRADNSPAPPLLSPQVGYFVYTKNILGPPQIINYPDRGPELGGPVLRKFTLGWAGPTRRLGLWKNSGPEMGPEAPK